MSWIPTRERSTRSSNTDAHQLCSHLWWVREGPHQNLVLFWTAWSSTRRDSQWVERFHLGSKLFSASSGCLGVRSVCLTAACIRWSTPTKLVANDIPIYIDMTINHPKLWKLSSQNWHLSLLSVSSSHEFPGSPYS